jgi:hypothetical protein
LVIIGLTLLLLVCCMNKGGRVVEGLTGDNPMDIATLFNSLENFDERLHCVDDHHCPDEVREGLRRANVAIKGEMCGDNLDSVNALLNGMIEANLFTDAATHLKTNIANRCK